MTGGLTHVTLTAGDLARSLGFYDAVLGPLGLVRTSEFADEEEDGAAVEAAGYGRPDGRPELWLVAGPQPTAGVHLAFRGPDERAVQLACMAALATGGSHRQAPRRWEIYRPGYFGGSVFDPDGNVIEAFCDQA